MCFSGVVRIALSLHLKAAAAAVSVEAVCFSSNTHTLSTLLISRVCSRKKVLLLLLLPFLVEETLTRVLVVLCLLALFFAVCVCVFRVSLIHGWLLCYWKWRVNEKCVG